MKIENERRFDPPLDSGIEREVSVLMEHGIQTFESCEGGGGHAYYEPTVRFHGDAYEGFRAYSIAMKAGLSVKELRRIYVVENGELTGPRWEITFKPIAAC